jgi:hypothetical protein
MSTILRKSKWTSPFMLSGGRGKAVKG